MSKREEMMEGIKEILVEDLIECNLTHENAPPHKDCGEECNVDIIDQIASANPILSPMRSGGTKHKKCMDCWNEYIDGLIVRIMAKQHSQGVVIEVKREMPAKPNAYDDYYAEWHRYDEGRQEILKWHNDSLEPLIKG